MIDENEALEAIVFRACGFVEQNSVHFVTYRTNAAQYVE
jgi:hypothetical protein